MGDSRTDLLARIVDEAARHGLADRSLRDLATAVGSSHRMLLYHFGSREGLVAAVVAHVEAAQRAAMTATPLAGATAVEVIRSVWARVSAEEMRPLVRLFFEAVACAGPAPANADQPDLTSAWVADAVGLAAQLGLPPDPAGARLGVAVIRGLLLDVVSGGSVEAATEAFEQFLVVIKDFRP